MDIERFTKISDAKIKAEKMNNQIQDKIKQYKHSKEDMQIGLKETFKPIIKAQEETKKTFDEKQDKLIEQLDKNQKALASTLEDIAMLQYKYEKPEKTTKLPVDFQPKMMEYVIDLDHKFNTDEMKRLTDYKLYAPSDVFKASLEDKLDTNEYDHEIGKLKQKLGSERGSL